MAASEQPEQPEVSRAQFNALRAPANNQVLLMLAHGNILEFRHIQIVVKALLVCSLLNLVSERLTNAVVGLKNTSPFIMAAARE